MSNENKPRYVWVFQNENGQVTVFSMKKLAVKFMNDCYPDGVKYHGEINGNHIYVNYVSEDLYIKRCLIHES